METITEGRTQLEFSSHTFHSPRYLVVARSLGQLSYSEHTAHAPPTLEDRALVFWKLNFFSKLNVLGKLGTLTSNTLKTEHATS